jgi:hypothetical protein
MKSIDPTNNTSSPVLRITTETTSRRNKDQNINSLQEQELQSRPKTFAGLCTLLRNFGGGTILTSFKKIHLLSNLVHLVSDTITSLLKVQFPVSKRGNDE